jgi:hypothetical protein
MDFCYCFVFETVSSNVAQTGLKLKDLLPLLPKCWDYGCTATCQAYELLLTEHIEG